MTQNKEMDAYFERLFEEKENIKEYHHCKVQSNHIWEFNYTPSDILEILKSFDPATKHKIYTTLTKIDFYNGDINHFLNYILNGYIQMQMEE